MACSKFFLFTAEFTAIILQNMLSNTEICKNKKYLEYRESDDFSVLCNDMKGYTKL